MGRKGDSKRKSKTKTNPASKAKGSGSVADLMKGKEAPLGKASATPSAPDKAQKKR